MKKLNLLVLMIIILFTSCEKEIIIDEPQQPTVDTNLLVINHFVDIVTEYYSGDGYLVPKRLHDGEVVVYLHESLSYEEKEYIFTFYERVSSLVGTVGNDMTFNYTEDSTDEFTIGIVHGDVDYLNEVFDEDYTAKETTLGKAFSWANSSPDSCMIFTKSHVFINDSRPSVLLHELGHTIGLEHTTKKNHLMSLYDFGVDGGMSEMDEMVVKLLYYEGELGNVMGFMDCETDTDIVLNYLEIEDLKGLLQLIIDNDFQ